MSNFEFQRFITIGQYLPTGSPIHRLDPRARLLAAGLLVGAITLQARLAGMLLAVVALLVLFKVARVPLSYALRGLLPVLPFILLLALLQLFLPPAGDSTAPLLVWGPLRVYRAGVLRAGGTLLQFVALILTLSLFSFCISTTEIIHGLESLLRPLTRLGLPTHDLVLVVQVTLRFLPLLAREAERIAKAQAARGAEWGTRGFNPLKRARQLVPLLLPLFLIALRRAETMALAMEARGYRGQGRTSAVVLRWQLRDTLALLFVLALMAVMFLT